MSTEANPTPSATASVERIESYENLLKLRSASPDVFMLRTDEATRRMLHWYEIARAQEGTNDATRTA